ncbi:MAG: flagellar basal-body rod protein FlgF [Desulfobacca sp.]|nr:flagellar basal-body rod protein FlgF [Desulfobacca sp.]
MLTSLYTGISGMGANSTALAVIGDNIANLNTTGFKGSRVNFGDVLSQSITGAAGSSQIGRGVKVTKVTPEFTQGSFEATGNGLDLAIDGDGLFIVRDGAAQFYTRAGQFTLDKNGNVVNSDGYALQGFQVDSAANITGTTGDITFSGQQSQANPTATATVNVNLDASDAIQGVAFTLDGNGDGILDDPANYNESTTIRVYDKLGAAHDVTMYFCKTAAGAWTAHYVSPNPANSALLIESATTQALAFGATGSLTTDVSTVAIPLNLGGAAVQNIKFNYGTGTGEVPAGTGFDGTTQFAAPFSVMKLSQDGYGAGTVSNISIGEDGTISASFTNGQSRVVGQVALARFMDPSSLTKKGRNLYQETYESGQAVVANPTTSGTGRVLANTLELSNVDLAQAFVKLISAQRAFQANSRIITTTDSLMQELVNMIR